MVRTIVADPPWRPRLHANTVGRREGKYRAGPQRYYELMSVEEICALASWVKAHSQERSHLYLWVLNQHVDWGYEVARSWGFEPQQMLTWRKTTNGGEAILGTGRFQANTEQVLVCRRGGPVGNAFGFTRGTCFDAPRGRHSEKPDRLFEIVEGASPGPYLEMFARRPRSGWRVWGREVD